MIRRLLLLNIVLAAVAIVLFAGIRERRTAFESRYRIDSIPVSPDDVRTPAVVPSAVSPGGTEWSDIAARNPFSFDRTDAPLLASDGGAAQAGPKPVLFGTFRLGPEWRAMLGPGQQGNRSFRPMKVGESLEGWDVIEIHEKAAVVRNGDRTETILMNDPSAQITRDHTRTSSTAAPAMSAPAAPGVPAAAQPAAQRPAPAPAGFPPIPLDASGQPKKGRWLKTPFGDVFIEDDRKP